jgi:formylglycine-generating enzyme required for sulfatase activity
VTRDDLEVKTNTFDIKRGEERVLEVTYIPKLSLTERGGKKKAEAPGPSAAGESKPATSTTRVPSPEPAPTSRKTQPPLPQPTQVLTNSIGMRLVRIEPGEFWMGSPDSDPEAGAHEKPQHRVRITRPFYLGVTEVTRGQFRRFVDEAGYQTEAERDGKGGWGYLEETNNWGVIPKLTWQNPGFEQTDEHPVVIVSWNDAQAFIAWLSRKEGKTYRLPTEAEWEYACRAGTKSRYFVGDHPEGLAAVGNVADGTLNEKYPNWNQLPIATRDRFVYTAPVGQFEPSRFWLYDMHGNVHEWCSDGYDAEYYKRSPVDDPPGSSRAAHRVYRGGSWMNSPQNVRSAHRHAGTPGFRSGDLGFRLARDQSDR